MFQSNFVAFEVQGEPWEEFYSSPILYHSACSVYPSHGEKTKSVVCHIPLDIDLVACQRHSHSIKMKQRNCIIIKCNKLFDLTFKLPLRSGCALVLLITIRIWCVCFCVYMHVCIKSYCINLFHRLTDLWAHTGVPFFTNTTHATVIKRDENATLQ